MLTPHNIFVQILPDDAFGSMMVQNLSARHCALLGIHAVPDLEAQANRFTSNGWDGSVAADMLAVYDDLPASEKVSCPLRAR